MAITKKDIEKLSDVFATKADLEKFATKADLEKFATKADLEKFATKAELKDGLNSLRTELKGHILTSEDKIMKKLEDISTEQKMSRIQSRRHEDQLEDHEKRISALEVKV